MRLLSALAVVFVAFSGVANAADCAAAPTPVSSLTYVSRYASDDAERDTVDPLREAEAEAAVAPVDDFILSLAEGVDAMYSGPVKYREATANCVLDQLLEWAKADALRDLETETVRLTIGSRFAAFALILWQTLPYAHDHPGRTEIKNWLTRRMNEQVKFWADAGDGSRRGNLRAWAGLAGVAVAMQTGDEALRHWSKTAILDVMCTANADGSLPQEMRRGRLALHYQLHAIAPLVTGAALLERQDIPASRACDGALHRIVEFALSDLDDGAKTRQIAGETQNFFDGGEDLEPYQLAWIAPYLALRADPEIAEIAERMAPLTYSKLGGNQTALWGH